MHLKASDWYAHGHETDSNYDNVILHVVWDDDVSVFRKDKTEIPTLELKNHIPNSLLTAYKNLLLNSRKKFINCENNIGLVDNFLFDIWLERLYVERLEQKATLIFDLLKTSNNDWEEVLFTLLLKNFGSKVNGEAFLSISKSLNFSIVRKLQNNAVALESVLMGKLIECNTIEHFYALFEAETSEYWINHYTFGKESKPTKKRLTKTTIDLVLINTIVPLKFAYAKSLAKDVNKELIALMVNISAEKNSIIKGFNTLGKKAKNAFESQAKLQLYNQYCLPNQCLKCTVGSTLLNEK